MMIMMIADQGGFIKEHLITNPLHHAEIEPTKAYGHAHIGHVHTCATCALCVANC